MVFKKKFLIFHFELCHLFKTSFCPHSFRWEWTPHKYHSEGLREVNDGTVSGKSLLQRLSAFRFGNHKWQLFSLKTRVFSNHCLQQDVFTLPEVSMSGDSRKALFLSIWVSNGLFASIAQREKNVPGIHVIEGHFMKHEPASHWHS